MNFAFSADCYPELNSPALLARWKDLGFDGIEAPAARAAADVGIVCLASNSINELSEAIDTAANVRCPYVRISGPLVTPHHSRTAVGNAFASEIAPFALAAAEKGVSILIDNQPSFRAARELWLILESINHQNVGISWDMGSAILAGESPFVSIPTLNSKIKNVRLTDWNLEAANLPVEAMIKRLMGIGYAGFVTLTPPAGSVPDDYLPKALATLKKWSTKPAAKKHGKVAAH